MSTPPNLDATLRESREFLKNQIARREPAPCPCCSRTVSVARRRIRASQAETLLAIYRETLKRNPALERRPTWIHVEHELIAPGIVKNPGRDWSVLRHWGVIARKTSARNPGEANNGFWSITRLGIDVVNSPRSPLLEAWIDTFNGKAWQRSPDRVSLVQALARSFDYEQEILAPNRPPICFGEVA